MNLENKVVDIVSETHQKIVRDFGSDALEYALEIYKTLPSCKHITGSQYYVCMREKYEHLYNLVARRFEDDGK